MERIIELLQGIRPEFNFNDSQNYIQNEMLDSFDMVILVTELEKVFGISIPGSDILEENFKDLESITRLVQRKGGLL